MEKGLVSIVVPVYKTEKYLNQCVQSIVEQTYEKLEILLIDDGSPDRCPQMCDAWAEKDSRIRVIHKLNEGLGMARNTGIENARGEYICFFDSDDYIDMRTIERAYAAVGDSGIDIGIFGFHTVAPDGQKVSRFLPQMEKDCYYGEEIQTHFLPELIAPAPNGNRKLYMSMCMMLFSMHLISRTGWRVASEREIISEDVYSILGLFRNVQSVAIVSEAFYYYRENRKSLSRSYRPERYNGIRHFYQESIALCNCLGYGTEIKNRLSDPFLSFTRSALKQEAVSPRTIKEKLDSFRRIISDETLQKVLWNCGKDHGNMGRRVLNFLMKHKQYLLCYVITRVKTCIH